MSTPTPPKKFYIQCGNAGVGTAPWSYNFLTRLSYTKAALVDDTNTATGVGISLGTQPSSQIANAPVPSEGVGEWPVDVLSNYIGMSPNVSSLITVTGLTANSDCRVEFCGHISNTNSATGRPNLITADSVGYEYTTTSPSTVPAAPTSFVVTADGSGTATFLLGGNSSASYINGLILETDYAPVTPTIDSIDSDNDVQVGQTGAIITTTGIDAASVTQGVTLGGEALTVTGWDV